MAFKLESDWPRLTETLDHPHPTMCGHYGHDVMPHVRELWQEHSRLDEPEPRYLVLCPDCAKEIIDPHPRLYRRLHNLAPAPGAMALCAECKHRKRWTCTNRDAKAHGGPGIRIRAPKPTIMHLDGTDSAGRRRGWTSYIYPSEPTACSGRVLNPLPERLSGKLG